MCFSLMFYAFHSADKFKYVQFRIVEFLINFRWMGHKDGIEFLPLGHVSIVVKFPSSH